MLPEEAFSPEGIGHLLPRQRDWCSIFSALRVTLQWWESPCRSARPGVSTSQEGALYIDYNINGAPGIGQSCGPGRKGQGKAGGGGAEGGHRANQLEASVPSSYSSYCSKFIYGSKY